MREKTPFVPPAVVEYLKSYIPTLRSIKDQKELDRAQGQLELVEHLTHLVRTQKGKERLP